jgi:hypothetical protein
MVQHHLGSMTYFCDSEAGKEAFSPDGSGFPLRSNVQRLAYRDARIQKVDGTGEICDPFEFAQDKLSISDFRF